MTYNPEGFGSSRDYVRSMQDDQVNDLVEESPSLENYKDALYQIRASEGWLSAEEVPLVAGEGEVLISMDRFDGEMGWETRQYKVVKGCDRANLEELMRVNQLPDYAHGFRVEDVAPVSEDELQTRIIRAFSSKLAEETKGFGKLPLEQKMTLLKKYGLA